MKDPKELRIGNLVMAPPDMEAQILIPDAIGTVSAILPFGDVILNLMPTLPSWKVPCKHLAPIPITPELCIGLGFNQQINKSAFRMDIEGIGKGIECFIMFLSKGVEVRLQTKLSGWTLPLKRVNSLHRLQNVLFDFAGQELELKQPVTA